MLSWVSPFNILSDQLSFYHGDNLRNRTSTGTYRYNLFEVRLFPTLARVWDYFYLNAITLFLRVI